MRGLGLLHRLLIVDSDDDLSRAVDAIKRGLQPDPAAPVRNRALAYFRSYGLI
jgi:hypothetical protein